MLITILIGMCILIVLCLLIIAILLAPNHVAIKNHTELSEKVDTIQWGINDGLNTILARLPKDKIITAARNAFHAQAKYVPELKEGKTARAIVKLNAGWMGKIVGHSGRSKLFH